MATIKLGAGKKWAEEHPKNDGPADKSEQYFRFKAIYSSFQEGKSAFANKETGVMIDWISISAQVCTKGVSPVYASCFLTLNDKDGNDDGESLHKIGVIYKAMTGLEAPEELDTDQFFLDCEGKEFVSKIFVVKEKVVDKEETEISRMAGDGSIQYKWIDKVDEKGYKSYNFSPFAISEAEYTAKLEEVKAEEREAVLEKPAADFKWDMDLNAPSLNEGGTKIVAPQEEQKLAEQVFDNIFGDLNQ